MLSYERTRALVISDDRRTRDMARATLEEHGYTVRIIASQSESLAAIKEGPDVVLFQVDLPFTTLSTPDEVFILRELLNDDGLAAHHAFILLSRTPDETSEVLGRILERLAVPLLRVPCTSTELVDVVAGALAQHATALTSVASGAAFDHHAP